MACFPTPYTHQHHDPATPVHQPNGSSNAAVSRFSGLISVSSSAIAAGNFSAWAHVGHNVSILPNATQLTVFVTPNIEFWVKAESWFGSYYSSEALAHLILWNNSGVEVVHEVRSLFRAIAPFWWYVDSGITRVPIGIVRTISRLASAAPETWHIALGLQTFAGGGGFGGCHANASTTVGRMCVEQFNSSGARIG